MPAPKSALNQNFHKRDADVRNNYAPEFNPTVKAKTQEQEDFFTRHLKQYSDFIAWAR